MNTFFKFFRKFRIVKFGFAASLIFFAVYGFTRYQTSKPLPAGDKDNGGLFLPDGFQALVVIDSLGGGAPPAPANGAPAGRGGRGPVYWGARHLAVSSNGDIYVNLRIHTRDGYGNAALRDVNGDGKADTIKYWAKYAASGYSDAMRIHNGYMYYSSELLVFRNKMIPGQLLPDSKMDTIVQDDPPLHEHQTKPVAFDGKGHMFVGWGAGSDACQVKNRAMGSPGMGKPDAPGDGCPLLKDHAGIWMFDENKLKQKQSEGVHYATGLRSIVGIEWDPTSNSLYALSHGRDNLRSTWPQYFTAWQSAMLPSEEFFKVPKGLDGGWPYYYYDQMQGKKMLNPEYGGDGKKEGNGAKMTKPLVGFPGHFALNDLLFYKGNQFPARYKEGVFIVSHGATNRTPYPQAGYVILFVPMRNGVVTGQWEVFADGFAGISPIPSAGDAIYRPMGLSEGPDGSIYISETQKGKIWRIMFKGNKTTFGNTQLAGMAQRKLTASNIKTPDEVKDNLDRTRPGIASAVYSTYCRVCHQTDGKGDGLRFPSLVESEWVNGNKTKLIDIVVNGLSGAIQINGQPFNEAMPAHGSFLNDKDIADVLTYVRSNFGNKSDAVSQAEVAAVRKAAAK